MMSTPDKIYSFHSYFSEMTEYGDKSAGSTYRVFRDNSKTWADARVGEGDKLIYSVFCDINVDEGQMGFNEKRIIILSMMIRDE